MTKRSESVRTKDGADQAAGQPSGRTHSEVSQLPAELLAKSMRWWAVAWRLESLPEEELGPVHDEALERLRARAGAGPLEIPGASLVVLAQR